MDSPENQVFEITATLTKFLVDLCPILLGIPAQNFYNCLVEAEKSNTLSKYASLPEAHVLWVGTLASGDGKFFYCLQYY